jgi:uncharacterized membrane protein YedE/YeeE
VNGRETVVAVSVGFVLAVALGTAGLTRPDVIVGWVDFFGAWDPTLLFFMAGAVPSYSLLYRLARRRTSALLGGELCIPSARRIDARLVAGSTTFGVGWALGGVCPGPALASAGAGMAWTVYFVPFMLLGLSLGGAVAERARR